MPEVVLAELNRRVETAGKVLALAPCQGGVRQAVHELGTVDRLLNSLLMGDALPAGISVCLGSVTDELSRHLAAVQYIDEDAPIAHVFALLQRALLSADIAIRLINVVVHNAEFASV